MVTEYLKNESWPLINIDIPSYSLKNKVVAGDGFNDRAYAY